MSRVRASFAILGTSMLALGACGARTGLDVPPPSSDVPPVVDCTKQGITYIYLITAENVLYGFYPPDLGLKQIGTIACDDPGGGTPYSMAVDRSGVAYVLFSSGNVFRVSTANASCKPTAFVPHDSDFSRLFGMGFSADTGGPGETLFVASSGAPGRLATIALGTFDLSVVGAFSNDIGSAELTGTGDGKLYGFGVESPALHLAQIDKTTATILGDVLLTLPSGNSLASWAFAYYGGDFYFFTGDGGASHISRYHPGDQPAVAAALLDVNNTIVGAGVSTCAPQQ